MKDAYGKEVDFERTHQELIAPALEAAGLGGGTTGEIIDAGNIREDMRTRRNILRFFQTNST